MDIDENQLGNIELEFQHRQEMLRKLIEQGGPNAIGPQLLRDLNLYQGQAGIWRDTARTASISGDTVGVTVSLVHRGTHYPDDLTEKRLVYHYPKTQRMGNTDQNEIDATKSTATLGLPLFVITTNEIDASLRDVRIGYITEWSDEKEVFSVEFSETRTGHLLVEPKKEDDQMPFFLDDPHAIVTETVVTSYERNPLFKRLVINRYGASCAVCGIDIIDLLDGAHLKGKRYRGSDDARNGLVLCATHHRAFDRNLFFIHPENLKIHPAKNGPSLDELRITKSDIGYLKNRPHKDALTWLWQSKYLIDGS